MALTGKSLFLYNFEVTKNNSSIDFRTTFGGPIRQATLNVGFYSLTSLLLEIRRALESADSVNTYTVSANRTFAGGTQNRVSIITSGSYLDLLFLSGPRTASCVAPLIGFNVADYTGATTYTGSFSAGVVLIPTYVGYSYLGPDFMQNVFGALTISANGTKEALSWQIQKFFQVEFRFEPEAKVIAEWMPFMQWAIEQKSFEFTPNYASPLTFYECTLESSPADGKGMGYRFDEMLPDFPFNYKTGIMKFRQKV